MWAGALPRPATVEARRASPAPSGRKGFCTMKTNDLVLITGAGGFIGGHLVAHLRAKGFSKIRAVDLKPLHRWYQRFPDIENLSLDLKRRGKRQRGNQQ